MDQKNNLAEQYAKRAFQNKVKEDLDRQINERHKLKEEENQRHKQIDSLLLLKD